MQTETGFRIESETGLDKWIMSCAKGLFVVVRSANKEDMSILFRLIKSAAEAGQGYGVDEFPTLDAFRSMTLDVHVVVVEESESRKVRVRICRL